MENQYPYGNIPPARPSSTTAIISLVAGILGLTLIPTIGSIVAVITGSMAKKEIRESGGVLGGEGMANAGIIIGWIGIVLTVLAICGISLLFLVPLCIAAFSSGNYSSFVLPALLAFI